MSVPVSTEERELELVGKVELRIGLAKDEKLESVLMLYLPPLLLKLESEHVEVRKKVWGIFKAKTKVMQLTHHQVISTCQHIKIRLAGNLTVVLPVAALLKQYKDHPDSVLIRRFDLLFIQQSIGKLPSQEQLGLLPVLLHGLAEDAANLTCATLFNLFLRLLPRLRLPLRGSKDDSELRAKLGLDDHVEDAKFVSSWFSKLMLLTIPRSSQANTTARTLPPGLTTEDYDFLTLNGKVETWDPNSSEGLNLTETKIIVLLFLMSGAFTHTENFIAAIFASADPNSRISTLGEDILKRTTISMEDHALIKSLYDIYFTSRPAVQMRVLSLLSKSTVATRFPQMILGLVQESMHTRSVETQVAKGLEALKLRNALFNFMNWVARVGSASDLGQVAPALVSFLRGYIEEQGWPVPTDRSTNQASLRALAYETLGSMAKTVPVIAYEPNLTLVRWLFRSLTEEQSSDSSIFISVEGALASLLNTFTAPLGPELKVRLHSLLLKYMIQQEDETVLRSARFTAVRWANRCLEYSDIVARWINILALGGHTNERSDVIEEGNKGLDPYWYRLINTSAASPSFTLPEWNDLVQTFFTRLRLFDNSSITDGMSSEMKIDGVSVLSNFSGQKINVFPHTIAYCRRMLLLLALENPESPITSDADWERQLNVLLRTDTKSRKVVKNYMKKFDQTALPIYFSAAFEGILWDEGNGLQDCGKTFVELGSLAPKSALEKLGNRAEELFPAIRSNKVTTRFIAAQAFGMLAPLRTTETQNLVKNVQSLLEVVRTWETAVGAQANKVHGSVLALGYLLSRCVYYGRQSDINEDLIQDVVFQLLQVLSNAKDATNKEAVLSSVAQLSAAGILTPTRLNRGCHDTTSIIKTVSEEAKKGNEKAIAALGKLAMVFDKESDGPIDGPLATILGNLYGLHELRQTEVHFTVGEALSCVAACWQSDSLLLALDVDTEYKGRMKRSNLLKQMMDKLLTDCKTTKPSLKKASGIWLFCLIQHCGHLEEIQVRLRECQAAFMELLSAREDFVQETASRGLSLVYEQGDKHLKDRLVCDLVASFTGTSAKLKVDEETELFEPGALPTSEGHSVTSYKDIMSLAAEIGDQSLVYKFMSLASNAATWSTRAAFGRFGLSSILSGSEIDPKLYSKLYRYRFDPNPNVQRSMNDIWTALVKNPTATIEEYFDAIMEELLKNILGKEWRTRQASCAAIADLVQGRRFEKYEKYLSQIWEVAFKVLDDIKGSVRKAAESLCQVLTSILVRQLEEGLSSKNAQVGLKEVMPFLFSPCGLESPAKEVQKFAYDTLLKLIKSGGKNLLPFIPSLIEQILGLLSTLEPDFINYIHLNAAKYDTTEEKIDEARSRMVSHSPMMEAIERCLDLLDEPTMKRLVPGLENVIKTAVGMPSKVGCGGVLVSLATRHSYVFRPHADIFLKDIEHAVLDRNSTVSAAYARTAGYIARLASDQQLLRLATYSKRLYFLAEDETRRQISADIIYAVSKFATDRFNSLASDFLPFVFIAKHDFDEHTKRQFEKTWDENVGGSRAVLLYLKEILSLSSELLDSPKWAIKHTAGLSIAEVVASAGDEISVANAELIWPALEKALAIKTFDGKEKILEAFIKLTQFGKSLWGKDAAIAAQMKKVAIREAKRDNEAYRPHAFTTLGEYAEARIDLDMFDEVFEIIIPHLGELIDEDRMDTTDDKPSSATVISKDAANLTASITAILRAIPLPSLKPSPLTYIVRLTPVLAQVLKSPKATSKALSVFYEDTKALFTGLQKCAHSPSTNNYHIATEFFALLSLPSGWAAGSEALRLKRAEAGEAIALALISGVFGIFMEGRESCKDGMRDVLVPARVDERAVNVQVVLDRTLMVLVG